MKSAFLGVVLSLSLVLAGSRSADGAISGADRSFEQRRVFSPRAWSDVQGRHAKFEYDGYAGHPFTEDNFTYNSAIGRFEESREAYAARLAHASGTPSEQFEPEKYAERLEAIREYNRYRANTPGPKMSFYEFWRSLKWRGYRSPGEIGATAPRQQVQLLSTAQTLNLIEKILVRVVPQIVERMVDRLDVTRR
jgi:hypothetical protein